MSTSPTTTPIKVAIIGSGITGLSLAYFLSHPDQNHKFEVTIYESHHRLGLDSQSICFEGDNYADGTFEDDLTDRIDGESTPHFISYSNQYNNTNNTTTTSSNSIPTPTQQPTTTTTSTTPTTPSTSSTTPTTTPKPRVRIDMPLRVFSTRYYPHLTSLLETLDVKYRSENYEASFAEFNGNSIFQYQNFLLGTFSIPYCTPEMLLRPVTRDIIRFLATAPTHLRNGRLQPPPGLITTFDLLTGRVPKQDVQFGMKLDGNGVKNEQNEQNGQNGQKSTKTDKNEPNLPSQSQPETLLQYLQNEGYSDEFIYHFEIPTVASICTCSYESAANYPAYIIIQYQTLRSGNGVRRVESGANTVVTGLSKYITHIKCNAAVTQIKHINGNELDVNQCNHDDIDTDEYVDDNGNGNNNDNNTKNVKNDIKMNFIEILDSNGERNIYNHVVFATQANQTSKILSQSLYPEVTYPTPPPSTKTIIMTQDVKYTQNEENEQNGQNGQKLPENGINNNNISTSQLHLKTTHKQSLQQPTRTTPQNWYDIQAALTHIPYESSELILHGDERFLPKNKNNWLNVNFVLPDINTVKSFVHEPPMMLPTNINFDIMDINQQQGANSSDCINCQLSDTSTSESPTSPVILPFEGPFSPTYSPSRQMTTLSNSTTISKTILTQPDLLPQYSNNDIQYDNDINNNTNNETTSTSTTTSTTTTSSSLMIRQFSENWLQTISRQSSSYAQKQALVMTSKIVSQNEGMSTIWMNKVQNGISSECNIFQTWNPYIQSIPNNSTIRNLYGKSFFQRPIVTFQSILACQQLWLLNGQSNIWCIGSYVLGGVPLLESGVASAYIVAQRLGAKNVLQFCDNVKESRLNDNNSNNQQQLQLQCNNNEHNNNQQQQQQGPILGWVNNQSKTNIIVEFIIYIIYLCFWICGAYNYSNKTTISTTTTTTSTTNSTQLASNNCNNNTTTLESAQSTSTSSPNNINMSKKQR